MLERKNICISFLWLFDSKAVFNRLKLQFCTPFYVLPDTAPNSTFLDAAFPTAQPRGMSAALPCIPMENTQNIPYQPTMMKLSRQDHLLHSIPRNNQIPRKHPAPPELLKESGSRGGDPSCSRGSRRAMQAENSPKKIYYYKKTNKTQLCHPEAMPGQEVQGMCSPCHDIVPAWCCPDAACTDGYGGELGAVTTLE